MSLLPLVRRESRRDTPRFYSVGFHGDQHLLALVDYIMQGVNAFIETGANVGSTLAYVARTHPDCECLSCEPNASAFQSALSNTADLPNVAIFNETSQEFVKRLEEQYAHLFERDVLFWLDAHGYGFRWPLREELAFITTRFKAAYVLIDDFRVPGLDVFGYNRYGGQECSFDYIRVSLNPKLQYNLFYPGYTERTSAFHPLRGWGLIEFGHDKELYVPDSVCKMEHNQRYICPFDGALEGP
jgi:hypothetical protein